MKTGHGKVRDIHSEEQLDKLPRHEECLERRKETTIIALRKLGWSLRRSEQLTGVRRETAGAYLMAAGVAVRVPGTWGRRAPAKPAIQVTPTLASLFQESQLRPVAGPLGHRSRLCG